MKYYYKAADYRAMAREALRNNWGMAILVTLVAMLLGAGTSIGSGASGASSNATYNFSYSYGSNSYTHNLGNAFSGIFATIGVFYILYFLFTFIMGASIELGLNNYHIRLLQRAPQQPFTTLFEKMNMFGRALWLRVVMNFFVFAWSLLFIIPGIVASYRYAMAPYLMAQNPNLTAMEAIEQSKQMMNGNKGRLFCLDLSFFGWILLAALTCGIGLLFVYPYIESARAAFYLDMVGQVQQPASYVPLVPGNAPYGGQPGQHPLYNTNTAWQQTAQGGYPQQPAWQPPAPNATWQPPMAQPQPMPLPPNTPWQAPVGSPYNTNAPTDGQPLQGEQFLPEEHPPQEE
ncbi:DUF975 family protein [Ruminococcaceae bacterium OttesenSCG-928-A16]|nr:DUF975 family protein [Ruminococcaceae bacterium OttesenSCG-928-A16]